MSLEGAMDQNKDSHGSQLDRRKRMNPQNSAENLRSKRQKPHEHDDTKHVRFGSEEPVLGNVEEKDGDAVPESDGGPETAQQEESDDDAPEAVGASEARAELRATTLGENRAREERRRAAKSKRQAIDSAFKEQAKFLKSHERRHPREKHKRERTRDSLPINVETSQDIPDLLPEDVLEDESFHEPTPEPATKSPRNVVALKKKRSQPLTDVVKDLKVGPVNVSVLKKQSSLLPPKATSRSQSAKQRWLRGRRGRDGPTVQRKKAVRSFLRS